jgi:hypothetical protein
VCVEGDKVKMKCVNGVALGDCLYRSNRLIYERHLFIEIHA